MENIEIEDSNPPIFGGFQLDNLKDLNVIVGKNNTGKTKFFESVEKKYKDSIKVVFIKANVVNPSDDMFKTSSTSASLMKILSSIIGENIRLVREDGVKDSITRVFEDVSIKFNSITEGNIDLKIEFDQINKSEILKSFIKNIKTGYIDSEGENISLDSIGQGYQRLLIVSLLQVYADRIQNTILEDGTEDDRETLILFEEPELFLHPELKRILNKSIKKIANSDGHQVILSTHDSYFLWSNMNDEESTQIYSFDKGDNGRTEVKMGHVGFGVEDEMLHIILFSKIFPLIRNKEDGTKHNLGVGMEEASNHIKELLADSELRTKEYQYNGISYNVILPIYIRNKIHHPENSRNTMYSNDELVESITILSHLIFRLADSRTSAN